MTVQIDLTGKTTIITGAGRGIGRHIATRFAEAGSDVVAAARTESELQDTVTEVENFDIDALSVPTDLSKPDDINRLMDETVANFGTPDILINNAGANLTGSPLEHSEEEIDTMLNVNLKGLFILSQHFARTLREHDAKYGRIINIASLVGHLGLSQMTFYGGTKSGVHGVTRGLASELARDEITVNSVSPGTIKVKRVADVIEDRGDEIYDFDRLPMGRVGEPIEVADTCLFLASDLASYITGSDIRVDGGISVTAGFYK